MLSGAVEKRMSRKGKKRKSTRATEERETIVLYWNKDLFDSTNDVPV
jgi:hypothetical protein